MICRKVMFADGESQWLMISQVEHARLSGFLAELCLDQFGDSVPDGEGQALDAIRLELLQAIIHHDDGWLAWEEHSLVDGQLQRPLSFDEVSAKDAFEIWTNSALAASQYGDLAAWIVASHFSAILATSEHHMSDPLAKSWMQATAEQRSHWFSSWHTGNEQVHSLMLAGEALKWLQLFDILSLWPCMAYPVAGEIVCEIPSAFQTAEDWILVREIRPASANCQGIVLETWPFQQASLSLQASALLAPDKDYKNSDELFTACQPFTARWKLGSD